MEGTMASVPPQGGRKHPQQEFLQVDTTDILFVCGGAFNGLEKIISARGRSASIGFSAKVLAPEDRKAGEIFREVEPGSWSRDNSSNARERPATLSAAIASAEPADLLLCRPANSSNQS